MLWKNGEKAPGFCIFTGRASWTSASTRDMVTPKVISDVRFESFRTELSAPLAAQSAGVSVTVVCGSLQKLSAVEGGAAALR